MVFCDLVFTVAVRDVHLVEGGLVTRSSKTSGAEQQRISQINLNPYFSATPVEILANVTTSKVEHLIATYLPSVVLDLPH